VKVFFHQNQKDRGQLKKRCGFSPDGGFDHMILVDQEKYHRSRQNQNVSGNDKDHKPRGNNVHNGKADKCGDQETFVRQGVKVGTQSAFLIENSRHQPVGTIAESGQNKNHESRQKSIIDDENQENGHQEYSEDTDQVRNGHKSVYSR